MTDSTDSPSETADDTNSDASCASDPCDACEENHDVDRYPVRIGDDAYSVCKSCREVVRDRIENFYWFDRLTSEHYQEAVEYLRSLDEVWCVIGAREAGEIWVHTPYCSAKVVGDVMDHYGFQIYSFSVQTPDERDASECVHDHGPCIEILLHYPSCVSSPLPLEADITQYSSDIDFLDESDRLFDK